MLPSDDGSIRKRLVAILKDPHHGQAIQDDLRSGLRALPEWMRLIVRDLLVQANSAELTAAVEARLKRPVPRKPALVRQRTIIRIKAVRQQQAMIEGFQTVLAASEAERRDLFVGAGNRLRTHEQNIEKDFWVCWTLDALFNGLDKMARACFSRVVHRSPKATAS